VSDELLNIFLSLHNTETWGQFHHHFYLRIFRTNIVLTAFSSYVWLWGKIRTFNVDEIDNRGQFYLRFTRTFLVQKSLSSFFLLSFGFEFLAPIFCTKNAWVKHWWNWLQGSFLSTYLCGFFRAQDQCKVFFWRTYLANIIWKISAHLFGFNFVSEIEQQFFFPNAVLRRLFTCRTKFGEIDPFRQFHQRKTPAFFVRTSFF